MTLEIPTEYIVVVGTTEPYEIRLIDNGVALDGTGLEVEFIMYRRLGGLSTLLDEYSTPFAEWLDQASGTVVVTGLDILEVGSYFARFRLTDSGGDFGYVPRKTEKADFWRIVPVEGI